MFLRPTAQDERWMAVAAQLSDAQAVAWLMGKSGSWKTITLLARCALFVLGMVAAGLGWGVFELLHLPGAPFVAGLAAVVVAESLVAQKHFFGAGIEEALEVTGLLLMTLYLIDKVANTSTENFALGAALVFAAAGIRLLNPLFITLATAAGSIAIYSIVDPGYWGPFSASTLASLFCLVFAAMALLMGKIQFYRPAYDRMLNWLVVAMPLVGYLWLNIDNHSGLSIQGLRNEGVLALLPLLAFVALGIAALTVGIRRRSHAPLLGFMACICCMAYELRNLTNLSLELKLVLWGTVVLLVALGFIRYLRIPRSGITSQRLGKDTNTLELLQLAGVGTLSSQSAPAHQAQFTGDGGTFGGGGASGRY